jgi:PhoH-like ATPase
MKNFVLDTNVVLHEPRAIFQFADNCVVLPIYAIEELDRFKKDPGELGRNARQVSRYLDALRNKASISQEGVPLPNGGKLRVMFIERSKLRNGLFHEHDSIDNKILAIALELRESEPDHRVILVSKDTNMRIRANAIGITSTDYEPEAIPLDELYTGTCECYVPSDLLNQLFQQQLLTVDVILPYFFIPEEQLDTHSLSDDELIALRSSAPEHGNLYPNQFILFKNLANQQHTALARVEPDGKTIVPLSKRSSDSVWGILPRNKEQKFALSLLLDERIRLVTLVGKAGTGKTLLAIATGLQQTLEEEMYQRLLVSRPIFPMGRDLGYLPGSMEEKLTPWMQPIFDNVEFLMNFPPGEKKRIPNYKQLLEMGVLQIEPLTYIRGRSIPKQFMIVDEAQNLTPHEVKTIITRVGDGTKIILTGDPYQIDHPYIDASDNGLIHAVKRFQKEGIAGHITLQKGERSELAELAANLL